MAAVDESPARRGAIAHERGAVARGLRSAGVGSSRFASACTRTYRRWRASESRSGSGLGRRCVVGIAHRAKRRRRPAQVYFCLPGRWEAEMSSSVRGPFRLRATTARAGVEPANPGLRCVRSPRDILSRTRPGDDRGIRSAERAHRRRLAGSRALRSAIRIRHDREFVNRDRVIASHHLAK